MYDLTELIKVKDEQSAEEINSFFGGLELPVPEMGEFYKGSGERFLTFLTDYGLVICITPKDRVVRQKHPNLIRSLFNRKAGKYEIDINPGFDTPVSEEKTSAIYRFLEEQGITVEDAHRYNISYVPQTEFPAVIDLDSKYVKIKIPAAKQLNDSVKSVKEFLGFASPVQEEPTPQDRYNPLRDMIELAWPEYHNAPTVQGLEDFRGASLKFKREGWLLSTWTESDCERLKSSAEKYTKKLRTLPHLRWSGALHV